jgi:hypothetical protein
MKEMMMILMKGTGKGIFLNWIVKGKFAFEQLNPRTSNGQFTGLIPAGRQGTYKKSCEYKAGLSDETKNRCPALYRYPSVYARHGKHISRWTVVCSGFHTPPAKIQHYNRVTMPCTVMLLGAPNQMPWMMW